MKQLLCDFCADCSHPPKWWYVAKDDVMMITSNIGVPSLGGKWAACNRCKELVDSKKMHTLAYISAEQYIRNHRLEIINAKDIEILKERVFNVQQAFWRNYDGSPAQPIERSDS